MKIKVILFFFSILLFLNIAQADDWLYMSDTDDFDDSQVTYAYEGGYYKPGYKKFISLKFSCYVDEKELILSVDIEDFITRKNSPFVMKYRIKPQKASEVLFQTWSNSYTGGFTKDKKEIDKF